MNDSQWVNILASIMLQSSPLIIAVCGETLTERAGVINLSLDGSMLISAMTGFVISFITGNLWLGFLAAAAVSALFALIVAFGSIRLRQNQVAIGFVLTLLGVDLANFLGQNYTRLKGPTIQHLPIPLLKDLPLLGPVFFDQDLIVYFALALVVVTWWWLFRTQPGLHLRSVGERPEAAFARGVRVNRVRYVYSAVGGALIGIAGASYSLGVKIGWSDNHILGLGWIALAMVIFGGWSPIRGAFGVLVYGATKWLATELQGSGGSAVAFNTLPWLLMIAVLLIVGSDYTVRLIGLMPRRLQPPLRALLRAEPPMALGSTFGEE